MRKHILSFLFFAMLAAASHANNLQIGPVSFETLNGSLYLKFTIGWSNSWRTSSAPFNWDAVWVFVKRRDCAGLQWRHVNLSPQDSSHRADNPLLVDAYADKKGVMIYRAANGFGNISNLNIKLKLDSMPASEYDYQVHGIEMVYVPQGSFYAGDGASSNSFAGSPYTSPYLVTNENPIAVGYDTGSIYCINFTSSNAGIQLGTVLPAAYPKGFNSFYCMKYEISQGQYANFLNSITQDAFLNRYPQTISGTFRYTIQGLWPQMQSLAPDRACNFMSFQDVVAYMDWAALSPMTELEFEKACRGSNTAAVGRELAWGNLSVVKANTFTAGTDGTAAESVTDNIPGGFGIANYSSQGGANSFEGPLRCGFAARPGTNRYQSGASYYGIMELSGNVMERCYNLIVNGINGGGDFNGTHGDGELSTSPNAGFSNCGWPDEGYSSYYYFDDNSAARRGGSWNQDSIKLIVSNRSDAFTANLYSGQYRPSDYGGRGVSRRQQ